MSVFYGSAAALSSLIVTKRIVSLSNSIPTISPPSPIFDESLSLLLGTFVSTIMATGFDAQSERFFALSKSEEILIRRSPDKSLYRGYIGVGREKLR